MGVKTLKIDRNFFSSYFHELFNSLNVIGGLSEPYVDTDSIEEGDLIDDLADIHDAFNTALLQSQKFKIVNNPLNLLIVKNISSLQLEKKVLMHFPLIPQNSSLNFCHKTERSYPNLMMPIVQSILYLCLHQNDGQLVTDQTITCKTRPNSIEITATNYGLISYIKNALDNQSLDGIQASSIKFELMFLIYCLSTYAIKLYVTNKRNVKFLFKLPEFGGPV